MARLTIYKDNYVDSTVVSNRFIDEYMKDANDAQLKIYLYLIRMLNANQATSVSDIADKFNHTEKDVDRALRYWQKKEILDLDYDADKNLVGIHLRDLSAASDSGSEGSRTLYSASARTLHTASKVTAIPVAAGASSERAEGGAMPVAATAMSARAEASERTAEAPMGKADIPMGKADIPMGSADIPMGTAENADSGDTPTFSKPVYTPDQLREFKSREETSQLLFIAESYIGKPLTPSEMKSILFFTDTLHFSDDLIDYLLQYCVDRGKKDFKYIEKVAINWAEEGITTPKQAQRAASRYDKNVYAIMNELGKNGSPTPKELAYINRWTKEYGFSTEIIFEACERTVMATDRHRFEYAEGILSSWKRENVHHKADIRRIDDMYQKRRQSAKQPSTSNKFNQFTQNHYDFDKLEKELLSN